MLKLNLPKASRVFLDLVVEVETIAGDVLNEVEISTTRGGTEADKADVVFLTANLENLTLG